MSSLSCTKEFSFCYAHHLPNHPGKCKNLHGHNAKMLITVDRKPYDSDMSYTGMRGMICDFSYLKQVINQHVIELLDHKCINELDRNHPETSYYREYHEMIDMPTAENMITWIMCHLRGIMGDCISRIQLYETSTSYVEIVR